MAVKQVYFVCLANEDRSPYAERFFGEECEKRGLEIRIGSGGINPEEGVGSSIDADFLRGSDLVCVMEEEMAGSLVNIYGADRERIRVLGIPDVGNFRKPIEEAILRQFDFDKGISKDRQVL